MQPPPWSTPWDHPRHALRGLERAGEHPFSGSDHHALRSGRSLAGVVPSHAVDAREHQRTHLHHLGPHGSGFHRQATDATYFKHNLLPHELEVGHTYSPDVSPRGARAHPSYESGTGSGEESPTRGLSPEFYRYRAPPEPYSPKRRGVGIFPQE